MDTIIISAISFIIAVFIGLALARLIQKKKIGEYEKIGKKILEDAKKEADVLMREGSIQAKDIVLQAKNELENETKSRRLELQNTEKRLAQKESNLDKKIELIDRKDDELSKKDREISQKQSFLDTKIRENEALIIKGKEHLEKISGLTGEEAKKMLMQAMEDEAKYESMKIIKKIEEEAREKADKKAKEIIAFAIQRYAGDYVGEDTVSVVTLPNEEMKGRIIGREGRNIRALEAATGVDIIIDEDRKSVV